MGKRKRNAAVGVVVAGAVAAALPLLGQIFSSFGDPTWQVRLIVLVTGLAGTAAIDRVTARRAERQQEEDRRATLRNALRAWPVPQLRFADPLDLGVFPAKRAYRGTEGRGRYYVERGVEAAIEDALDDSFLVLVHGPKGAGKSRTAFHAARSKFPEADVMAPRDGRALIELLDLELPRSSSRLVVWLDGLDRYADAIDANVLDRVLELGGTDSGSAARVVATVETAAWRNLLTGGGQGAEAAKAIAARSRAVELKLDLSARAFARAAELYPDADLSQGFGPGLGAPGTEEAKPVMPPRPQVPEDPSAGPGPWRRDLRLVLPAAASFGLAASLIVLGLTDNLFNKVPDPIDVQVSRIERGLAKGTPSIRGRRVALHGSGEKAYVYEITDRGLSHELRVYDVRGGTVDQAFRFRPKPIGYRYEFVTAIDVDDDGREELVGGYRNPKNKTLLPFMVEWDAGDQSYRMVALQPTPETRSESARAPVYSKRVRLRDYKDPGKLFIRGFPTAAVSVSKGVNPRLLTGYNLPGETDVKRRLRVHASIFAFGDNDPRYTRCHLVPNRPIIAKPDATRLPNSRVLDAWNEAAKDQDCAPNKEHKEHKE